MSLDELSLRHHSRNAVPIPKFLANDHNVLHHSTSSIIPKKLAIKYDRPMLVLFYLNGRHGKYRRRCMPLRNLDMLETAQVVRQLCERHPHLRAIKVDQLRRLVGLVREHWRHTGRGKEAAGWRPSTARSSEGSQSWKSEQRSAEQSHHRTLPPLKKLTSFETISSDGMKSTTDALSTAESREAVIRDDQKERRHKHADDGRDLNKMSDAELAEIKEAMNTDFERNRSKPGDPGYKYDVQLSFGPASEENDWDRNSESDGPPQVALARGPSSLPPLPVSRIEDHDALKDVDQLLDEVDYSIEEDIEEPIQSATDAHQAYTLEGQRDRKVLDPPSQPGSVPKSSEEHEQSRSLQRSSMLNNIERHYDEEDEGIEAEVKQIGGALAENETEDNGQQDQGEDYAGESPRTNGPSIVRAEGQGTSEKSDNYDDEEAHSAHLVAALDTLDSQEQKRLSLTSCVDQGKLLTIVQDRDVIRDWEDISGSGRMRKLSNSLMGPSGGGLNTEEEKAGVSQSLPTSACIEGDGNDIEENLMEDEVLEDAGQDDDDDFYVPKARPPTLNLQEESSDSESSSLPGSRAGLNTTLGTLPPLVSRGQEANKGWFMEEESNEDIVQQTVETLSEEDVESLLESSHTKDAPHADSSSMQPISPAGHHSASSSHEMWTEEDVQPPQAQQEQVAEDAYSSDFGAGHTDEELSIDDDIDEEIVFSDDGLSYDDEDDKDNGKDGF